MSAVAKEVESIIECVEDHLRKVVDELDAATEDLEHADVVLMNTEDCIDCGQLVYSPDEDAVEPNHPCIGG